MLYVLEVTKDSKFSITFDKKFLEFYSLNPPEALVGDDFLPINIEYEKKVQTLILCEEIRIRLYPECRKQIDDIKEEDIKMEKLKLGALTRELARFTINQKKNRISNNLLDKFLKENKVELVWSDSRDILRIGASLIVRGVR